MDADDAGRESDDGPNWARVGLFSAVTIAVFVWGAVLLPAQPPTSDLVQPTISIFSSQRLVTAVFSMTAFDSVYRRADTQEARPFASTDCPSPAVSSSSPDPSAAPTATGSPLAGEPSPSVPANPLPSAPATPPPRPAPPPSPPPPAVLMPKPPAFPPVPGQAKISYHLELFINVISRLARPVTLVVVLNDMPHATGAGLEPLDVRALSPAEQSAAYQAGVQPAVGNEGPGRGAYISILTIAPSPPSFGPSLGQTAGIDVITPRPLVSLRAGPDIQIDYPLVEPQSTSVAPQTVPAGPPPPPLFACQALSVQSLPLGTPSQLFVPNLEAGNTQFYAGAGTKLADYQAIIGDPAVVRPAGAWSWTKTDGVTMLAQNVLAENAAQGHLFDAGILFGVAGSAGIAMLLELLVTVPAALTRRRAARNPKPSSATQ